MWLVLLTGIASGINYLSSMVFSRVLTPSSFGDLTALLALTLIVAVPTGAAQTVIAARIAELRVSDPGGIPFFVRHAMAHIATVSAVIGALYIVCIPLFVDLLDLQAVGPAIALIPLLMLSFFMPGAYGLLQGFERFFALGVVLVIVAASRIVLGLPWALADQGGPGGPIAGQAIGNALALLAIVVILRPHLLLQRGTGAARSGLRRRPDRRSLEAGGAFVAFAVLSNADVLLAKLLLSAHDAGLYAALATLEKIVLFLPGAVALAIVPHAARVRLEAANSGTVLRRGVVAVIVTTLVVGLPMIAEPSLTMRLMFGSDYTTAADGVLPIVIAGGGLSLLYLLIVYTVAIRDRRLQIMLGGGLVLQVAVICAFHASVTAVATAQAAVVATILVANELWGHPMWRARRG